MNNKLNVMRRAKRQREIRLMRGAMAYTIYPGMIIKLRGNRK